MKNDGQNIEFNIGPNQKCNLNNLTSGASTIKIYTSKGSITSHVVQPGAGIDISAGDEVLEIKGQNFTPVFEGLSEVKN